MKMYIIFHEFTPKISGWYVPALSSLLPVKCLFAVLNKDLNSLSLYFFYFVEKIC